MDNNMTVKDEIIDQEFPSNVSYEDFIKTERYTELVEESKVNHPDVDVLTIKIMIHHWYCTDILKQELPPVLKPEPEKEFDHKTISVYDPDEHLAKYGDVFKQKDPIIVDNDPEVSVSIETE